MKQKTYETCESFQVTSQEMVIVSKEVPGTTLLPLLFLQLSIPELRSVVLCILIKIQHIRTAFRTKCPTWRDVMTDRKKVM